MGDGEDLARRCGRDRILNRRCFAPPPGQRGFFLLVFIEGYESSPDEDRDLIWFRADLLENAFMRKGARGFGGRAISRPSSSRFERDPIRRGRPHPGTQRTRLRDAGRYFLPRGRCRIP